MRTSCQDSGCVGYISYSNSFPRFDVSIGDRIFEARHINFTGDKFVVKLDQRECSCKRMMLTWVPCCHAVRCCKFLREEVEDLISSYYKRETYEACYQPFVYPTSGQNV